MKIHSTSNIVNALAFCGISAKVDEPTLSPATVNYKITLAKPTDIKRLKGSVEALQNMLGFACWFNADNDYGVIMSLARPHRANLPFLPLLPTKPQSFAGDVTKPLNALVGVGVDNNPIWLNLAKLPHLLLAGSTGSGKSVALNTILCSLLRQYSPNELRIVAIDPKKTELSPYSALPHLTCPTIVDTEHAIQTLEQICDIMDKRYSDLAKLGKRDIQGTDFKRLLIIIDEVASLTLQGKGRFIKPVTRIIQEARAAGIHLILCTQSPKKEVLPTLIRENIAAKICLKTSSAVGSNMILGHGGAEKLCAPGDAIFQYGIHEQRIAIPFCTDDDVLHTVAKWKPIALVKSKGWFAKLFEPKRPKQHIQNQAYCGQCGFAVDEGFQCMNCGW